MKSNIHVLVTGLKYKKFKNCKIELKEVDYEIIKNVKSLPDFLNEN